MYQLILFIHIFAAACLVLLVMVQQGKGAVTGAAFGSGASQTVFGSRGSGSFLLKLTIGFVAVFFVTSIALNYLATQQVKQSKQFSLPAANPALPQTPPLPPSLPAQSSLNALPLPASVLDKPVQEATKA